MKIVLYIIIGAVVSVASIYFWFDGIRKLIDLTSNHYGGHNGNKHNK